MRYRAGFAEVSDCCRGSTAQSRRNGANVFRSAAVIGRSPCLRMIRSDSRVDIVPLTGFTSTNRGSMSEEVRKVGFGIFCAITDGLIKSFCEPNIVHPPLETQALIRSKDIPVRRPVRGVIPGDVDPFPGKERQQDDCKLDHGALGCRPANDESNSPNATVHSFSGMQNIYAPFRPMGIIFLERGHDFESGCPGFPDVVIGS